MQQQSYTRRLRRQHSQTLPLGRLTSHSIFSNNPSPNCRHPSFKADVSGESHHIRGREPNPNPNPNSKADVSGESHHTWKDEQISFDGAEKKLSNATAGAAKAKTESDDTTIKLLVATSEGAKQIDVPYYEFNLFKAP